MINTSDKYLIDTNSLVTPYKTYYPFDFAKKFWDQMYQAIDKSDILILDLVYEELKKGDDQLSEWINEVDCSLILNHIQPAIIT
jgi:rRNA-processing protein FCF1